MTPAFRTFVAPAMRRPALWRLALGLAVSATTYVGIATAVVAAFGALGGKADGADWMAEFLTAESPRSVLAMLAGFVGMALGPMAAVLIFHRRGPGTLFGRAPVVLRDFALAVAVAGTVLAISVGLWLAFSQPVPGRPAGAWLAVLPLALTLVLIQTGAEELLFRGYMQQQLAARFTSPLVWAVLPSLIFGLLHYAPSEAGTNAWIVAGAAAIFGLAAADLTARTGSLGAAWGFHFANNTLALLIIATDGALSGLALYKTPYRIEDPQAVAAIPLDLLVIVVIWFLLRRLLAR